MATTVISQLSYVNALNWALTSPLTPFQPETQGPDNLTYNGGSIDLTIWNRLYLSNISLTTGATTTIDLTALTDLLGNAIAFGHIWLIVLKPVLYTWTVEPGAANGLEIFGGTGVILPVRAGLNQDFKCGTPAGAASGGLTVDATHKNLKLTNTGAGTDTAQLAIHGSST